MNRINNAIRIAPFIQSLTFDPAALPSLPFVKIASLDVTPTRNITGVEQIPHFAIRVYDVADGQICNVWLRFSDYTADEKPVENSVAERLMKNWIVSLLAELSSDHETTFKLVVDDGILAAMPYMAAAPRMAPQPFFDGGHEGRRGYVGHVGGQVGGFLHNHPDAQQAVKEPTEEELTDARITLEARRVLAMADAGQVKPKRTWGGVAREGIAAQEIAGGVLYSLSLRLARDVRFEAWAKDSEPTRSRTYGPRPETEQAISGTLKLLGQESRFEVTVPALGDQAYHAVSRALIQQLANTRFREMVPFAIDEQGALELHFDTVEQ